MIQKVEASVRCGNMEDDNRYWESEARRTCILYKEKTGTLWYMFKECKELNRVDFNMKRKEPNNGIIMYKVGTNGYMVVVIPPDIMDDKSADGAVTHEGGEVTLKCVATGSPKPTVTWKREDGQNIVIRKDGKKQLLETYVGETLVLSGVLRQEMGTYLCIASNNVPPTVSKRYSVQVHFRPVVKVPNQLLGAPIDSNVLLQCLVEASPQALNTWHHSTGRKLSPNAKYSITEYALNEYSWQMNLTINSLKKTDFGEYICSSLNAFGNATGMIHLRELDIVAKTTPSIFVKNTDLKPRKKPITKGRKENSNSGGRRLHLGSSDDFDSSGNDDDLSTTQIMAGSTLHEGHRTERPLVLPSLFPPSVIMNTANSRHHLPITLFSLFILTMILIP
ncbi:Lachesin [Eufriesea mexicana]|nr:Lachesin [Eufriesea mexicana]